MDEVEISRQIPLVIVAVIDVKVYIWRYQSGLDGAQVKSYNLG